jgi:hypothetical protein
MKYSINLVREIRMAERRREIARVKMLAIAGFCFGLLILSVFYACLNTFTMYGMLKTEREKLRSIEAEYRKYKETRMIVDKADIELLDSLQNSRIFWTKKLVSMAVHLPDNFWVTKFGFDGSTYNAEGNGYISQKQEQLVVLDQYMNELREDPLYKDVFKRSFLNSIVRKDEKGMLEVEFSFSSVKQ